MKIKHLLSCAIIAATMITAATSCKKKDDEQTCRIVTVTSNDGTSTEVTNITYNNDGKVSTISQAGSSGYSKVFTYSGSTINITESNGSGTITYTYVVTLNSKGNVSTIVETPAGGSNTYTLTAQYDGNGNLTSLTSQSGGGSPSVTATTFTNGDLTTFTGGSFEYYTDKSFQDGDYIKLQQWLQYGALYIVNKHLVKSSTFGTDVTNFSYEFTDGRISKLTSTGTSGVSTVNYQYSCN